MTRYLVLCSSFLMLGCSDEASPPRPIAPKLLAAPTQVIVVAADGSTAEVVQEVEDSAIVGDYFVGDGLGYNLHLVLNEGGQFECTWTGCLGVYGTASGEWSVQDSGLKLVSHKADGMLEDKPLDTLLVICFQEHFLLLQETDRDWFDEHGPDTFCCLHKQEAEKPLGAEWLRRIEEKAEE